MRCFFWSSYQAGNDEHSGGYWKQWFNREDIGEENRLAYVAFQGQDIFWHLEYQNQRVFQIQTERY